MKFIYLTVISLIFIAVSEPAHAQRQANTSGARAAYSDPLSGFQHKSKKKKKKSKRSKQAKKFKSEADRKRRSAWAF